MSDNPYQVLGLPQDASEGQIKKAYHKAALKYHPDRQSDKENKQIASAKFAEISEAYETLTDPVKRYDWRQKQDSGHGSGNSGTSPQTPSSPPRGSPSASTSYQYSNPVSNSSKRADFMARKNQKQNQSVRSSFASPVSPRRKRQPQFAAAPPPPSPMRSARASVRSSVRRPASASPGWNKKRVNGNTVNMDGSVRSTRSTMRSKNSGHRMPQAPMTTGSAHSRRTVGRTSMMPQAPLSAGAPRRTIGRMSRMPQPPPLSPGTRRRDFSQQQQQQQQQGPLPTISTPNGRVLRQSVRIRASGPSPRATSPRRPTTTTGSGHMNTGSGHMNAGTGSGHMVAPPPLHTSTPPSRKNSLDGTGRKKRDTKPVRKVSLDGSSRKTKKKKKKPKERPASQPPPPPGRKSIFGGMSMGIRSRVHNHDDDDDEEEKSTRSRRSTRTRKKKKKKKTSKKLSV